MLKIVIFTLIVLYLQSDVEGFRYKKTTCSTPQEPLKTEKNMKIIRANNKTIGKFQETWLETTPIDAMSHLTRIKTSLIQFIELETNDSKIIRCNMHPFVQALHLAFKYHLPVVISPDMIWYLISSGAAIHIKKNSEELRHKFVNHSDKKEIIIQNDNFVFKSKKNEWSVIIDQFAQQISSFTINNISDLFVSNFSTTNKQSRIVSQIVLMDSMQNYFDYTFRTLCGIPEIRVTGTVKDWIEIRTKTKALLELLPKLKIWSRSLDEILTNFIDLYSNKIDVDFWDQIYKQKELSGGPFITGWIIGLFPYINQNQDENNFIFSSSWRFSSGIESKSFFHNFNQVPFLWQYHNVKIKMLFIGGLVGIRKESDQALVPVFGYGVSQAPS